MTVLDNEVARHEQEAIGLLCDWAGYLRARLAVLERGDTGDAFDQGPAQLAAEDAARALAGLDPARRALFERAVAERREQERPALDARAGGRPADPDELDRVALRALLEAAERPDESGHLLFPYADGGDLQWMELRASALAALPDVRAYRAASRPAGPRERALRLAAGVAALALALTAGRLLLWPDEGAAARPAEPGPAAQLTLWPVTTVTLVGGETVALPATPAEGAWPSDGRAHLRAGVALPLRLCAPGRALAGLREVRVAGDGTVPERVYSVGDGGDLALAPCEGGPVLRGALTRLDAPPTAAPVGAARQVAGQALTLAAADVRGAAESPDVPEGSARVALRMRGGDALDWAALTPELALGDGTRRAAPEVRPADGGAELIFLVPAPLEALAAELRLRDPSGALARWRVDLAPPPGRQEMLAATLHVEALTAEAGGTLALTISARGAPVTLAPGDILITDASGAEIPAGLAGPVTLAPGETRTIAITLPDGLRSPATLAIGAARFQLLEGDTP